MKIGARIFKTSLTTMLALYISSWLGLEPPMLAAIAAALTVQPSVYRSWQNGWDQIKGNLIGAAFALAFAWLLGTEPYIIALTVMLVIAINLRFNLEKTIPLSVVTILAVMTTPEEQFFHMVSDRLLLLLIGLLCSLLINISFFRPNYANRLLETHKSLMDEIALQLRIGMDPARDMKLTRKDLKRLEERHAHIRELYQLLQEENRTQRRKKRLSFQRMLVVHREMIELTHIALQLLQKLHRKMPTVEELPENLRQQLEEHLTHLANDLEKLHLLLEGRIRDIGNDPIPLSPEQFQQVPQVWPLLMYIQEYIHQRQHVERLIASYLSSS